LGVWGTRKITWLWEASFKWRNDPLKVFFYNI
jgi:hypothetical protein